MKKYILLLLLLVSTGVAMAQDPLSQIFKPKAPEGDRLDSLLALLNAKKGVKIRPYTAVITKEAITHHGPFTVHEVRDSFFIELPDTLFDRRMQLIHRLVKGAFTRLTGGGGSFLPGDDLETKTVYFAPGPNSSINLLTDVQSSQADPTSRIAAALKSANTDPILQSFNIVAIDKERHCYVIDATSFLKASSPLTSIDKDPGKSFHVEYVHAYPINVEFGIYRAYGITQQPLVTNSSFILLPKVPMQQRIFDRRVGYMTDFINYFSDDQQKVEKRQFILRWRLEPRSADLERWKRGELVEPNKPIVIYIDPSTPKQWVKYLIMGINDWQKAFEKAGFKNAIIGREWTKSDSVNLDDARYSFIDYQASDHTSAYGPNIHDARSGEIIQTHIAWSHNVMSLLHDWYMIQAGATDPRARKPKFDDELMGQLIRFVVSHEVGHTLGLRHNFGASSTVPVEKLRDKEWLRKYGHTASIMDYARFNYVAQPEDKVPAEDLLPHIGDYDLWAIEWGYKYSGANTVEEDKKITGRWATERLKENPRLWFGSMEGEKKNSSNWTIDPRSQADDLGDNNMIANTYGIKNLKRILPNLPSWTHEANGQYQNLEAAYKVLKEQYKKYLVQVLVNIGGVERTYKTEDEKGNVYAPVSKAKQKQAIAFLNDELFTTPRWLIDPAVVNKVPLSADESTDFIGDLQVRALNSLLDTSQFTALSNLETRFGKESVYTQREYLKDIHRSIWGEVATAKPMDAYRRNLQKSYIGALSDIVLSVDPGVTETECFSIATAELLQLEKEMETALPKYTNLADRNHLESQIAAIKRIFETKTS